MFLHEFLTTLLWPALLLLATIFLIHAFQCRKTPTLRVHRYLLRSAASRYFWSWLVVSLCFYISCGDFSLRPFNLSIPLLIILARDAWADRRKKRFFEDELQEINGTLIPPQPRIEKSSLSVFALKATFVFYFAATLLCTAAIADKLFVYLHHPDEYLIGSGVITMIVMFHLLYFGFSWQSLSKKDFPEITPENQKDFYRKAIKGRGDPVTWGTLLLIVWCGVMLYCFYTFARTPFASEVGSRIDASHANYRQADFRTTTTVDPESRLMIAACEFGRDNFWTAVYEPFGFAGDDDGRMLWSELLKEVIVLQTRDETVKPQVEPMTLAPDFLEIPFYFKLEKRNDAVEYLKNVVFGNRLDEATFDAAKTSLLEKIRKEATDPALIASKFALAARRQVCDFGSKNIVVFADLENADWTGFQEYYRDRFSRYQIPLVFEWGVQSSGACLDEIERQFKTIPITARQIRPRPQAAAPSEYRAVWDVEFPAIVATWPLPDPKTFPDEHADAILAVKGFERQLFEASNETVKIAAVQSALFAAPEGLIVSLSVVGERQIPADKILALVEEYTGSLTATNSVPDWLKTERRNLAVAIVPSWDFRGWGNSALMQNHGAKLFQYAPFLENEEQYRTLASRASYANFWSVKRAFEKHLTKDKRTLVVLNPAGN